MKTGLSQPNQKNRNQRYDRKFQKSILFHESTYFQDE